MAALFIGLDRGRHPGRHPRRGCASEERADQEEETHCVCAPAGIDLLLAALVLAVGADAPTSHMTVGLWWFTIIVGGIPLALVSGLAVRRGYAGHQLVLAAATLRTAALYVVFPFAFIPVGHPLTGLGRWVRQEPLAPACWSGSALSLPALRCSSGTGIA